ncbi:MAG: protein kinase [Planctomycetota bacterium]|nr:protein kinase [Planctomycetota bacterium]
MKQRLGNFELLEQIDPGGYTIVWRAVEHMGHGITRPAAVKILQNWNAADPEKLQELRNEVGVLAELGTCPNIVTIYAFDVDPDLGPWIAMELGGRNLRHYIGEEPSPVDTVRQLMRDSLRALHAVHSAKPQILHRDLKPNNILATEFGSWKLADFGLAKRGEGDSTLNVLTVQYTAPELLDGTLGPECPATDLYSLGLVIYEFALGRRLYRAQFPSVFDPFADADAKGGDDRPKWMYWHTSRQMTLKPLVDLLPDFPKDISDLVAAMTAKPVDERIQTAAEALSRLGEASGSPRRAAAAAPLEETVVKKKRSFPIAWVALPLLALAVLAIGGWVVVEILSRPSIELASEGKFKSNAPTVNVTGRINRFPKGGTAIIATGDGGRHPVVVDSTGKFTSEVRVDKVGRVTGDLRVTVGNVRVLTRLIELERQPPASVRMSLIPEPNAEAATITITPSGAPDPIVVKTGADGKADVEVPYGRFDIKIEHPRFEPFERAAETGADPERTSRPRLRPLSEQALAQKRQQLLSDLNNLAERAAAGDPEAVAQLEAVQQQLAALDGGSDTEQSRRTRSLVADVVDTARRAAAGDERAAERLRTLRGEIEDTARGVQAAQGSEKRQRLMNELRELSDRAAAGDPAALARLKQVTAELRELDAEEGVDPAEAAQRSRMLAEMTSLAERAARGDQQAAAALRSTRQQFEQLGAPAAVGGPSARRQQLTAELEEAVRAAARGDPQAAARVRELTQKLQDLDRDERVPARVARERAQKLAEMADLATRAASGDINAARRLQPMMDQFKGESQQAGAEPRPRCKEVEDRRAALVRELGELTARGLTNDPAAVERMKKIRSELQAIELAEGAPTTEVARRRTELLGQLAALTELAASGDPEAAAQIKAIQKELAVLTAIESSDGSAENFAAVVSQMIGGAPSLDLLDRATLLKLSEEQFRAFIEVVVPRGALDVETVPNLKRLRVRGSVLHDSELVLLMARLDPAMPRLMLEVRTDAWALVRRLTDRLLDEGYAGVRVHPFIFPVEKLLLVQFRRQAGRDAEDAVRTIAEEYLVDKTLLIVQGFDSEPPRSPKAPSSEPGQAQTSASAAEIKPPSGR